ncbi:MAG: Crp/Fnr family transcriptional regulator [Prolixibacteraceae bacterium]|nr:Crp/Fnr family transcriptional regulator [Prolixibacteraceae bacterium]
MEQNINRCSCEQCQLKSLFFSHVKSDELLDICQIKQEKYFINGDTIIKENEPIREFIYMKEGLVKLSRNTTNSKEQIISFSKPFDFVSLLSVFSSDRYKYSVTALENSVVCMLNLNIVKKYAGENALFAMDLMTRISEATDKIIIDNLDIKRKNLKGRVAHVLLYFSKYIYHSEEFELPVSRREIADFIGMTTENVIRALSEFRKDKIIKIFGKDIQIVDIQRLETISELG